MDLHPLRHIVALAEPGNFPRAAERLIDSIARIDARYVPAEDLSGRPLGVAV